MASVPTSHPLPPSVCSSPMASWIPGGSWPPWPHSLGWDAPQGSTSQLPGPVRHSTCVINICPSHETPTVVLNPQSKMKRGWGARVPLSREDTEGGGWTHALQKEPGVTKRPPVLPKSIP